MKHLLNFLFLSLICLIPYQATAQNYTGKQKHIDRILENTAAFSQAYLDADAGALSQFYTVDGKILPPGTAIIQGRAAIKERWTLPEGVSILHHKVTPEEINIIGKYAYDIGYYEGATKRADDTEVSWKGKYMIVWKKVNNDWKIYSDIWNNVK